MFYGRRRYVKLLNVYLERNLAKNGGILDEVNVLTFTLEFLFFLLRVFSHENSAQATDMPVLASQCSPDLKTAS